MKNKKEKSDWEEKLKMFIEGKKENRKSKENYYQLLKITL